MSLLWKNNGPLSGGGGGIVPENVVTAEGGAAMLFTGLGGPPFSVEFVDEEEPPLTAADITYQDESVEEALSGLFTSVSSGKARIASAITDKGVPTQEDATFADMAENIRQNHEISTPNFQALIEEGIADGSIRTQYPKELAELMTLLPNLWLAPSVIPGTREELFRRFCCLGEMLEHMGLPLFNKEILDLGERFFQGLEEKDSQKPL